jgi:hypothetical protein
MTRRTGFTSSPNIILTGWSGVGKTEQARRVFNAVERDPRLPEVGQPKGREVHPFRPMCVIRCEASTAVTMADVLAHPDCTEVVVETAADFAAALRALYEDEHGNRVACRFGSVFFDGWTTLCENATSDAMERARAAEGARSTSNQDASNDNRKMREHANKDLRMVLKAWNAAVACAGGTVFLSTAHADEKWMPKPNGKQGERIQVGEQPNLPPLSRRWLYNSASLMLLLQRVVPEADSLEALEQADDEQLEPTYHAITRPCTIGGYDYADVVKWQAGLLDLRAVWREPDLGAALLVSPMRKKT